MTLVFHLRDENYSRNGVGYQNGEPEPKHSSEGPGWMDALLHTLFCETSSFVYICPETQEQTVYLNVIVNWSRLLKSGEGMWWDGRIWEREREREREREMLGLSVVCSRPQQKTIGFHVPTFNSGVNTKQICRFEPNSKSIATTQSSQLHLSKTQTRKQKIPPQQCLN